MILTTLCEQYTVIFTRGAATIISGIKTRPTDPLIPAFATALRRRREALDLSQEALARRAGISTVFVGRVESLRNQPTINSMQKLAKGLDARLSDLIREAEALAKR